ncbi:MAG TPA: TAT-variant-translocated molybdopterin oxidoreductase [Acidobacteriota bacterium]|nr:TAT-variant-translocated molybdopterin oxidoreductase [Acidobacteriota bacterium]
MKGNRSDQTVRLDLRKVREALERRTGRDYWRSLEEVLETEEAQDYLRHEFPAEADTFADPVGRRQFLRLMGASLAFAGATACVVQPEERIVPHVRAPEQLVPGRALYFASCVSAFGFAQGLLVESHDGRPTKIEGNPNHPASLGAATAFAQASVLDLYDPDRLQTIQYRGRIRTWTQLAAALETEFERFRLAGGKGLRILTGTVTSPTLGDQLLRLSENFPEARWVQYEPVSFDHVRAGRRAAFGQNVHSYSRLEHADVVFSLDADFLTFGPAALADTRAFSAKRRIRSPESQMNRLYAVESSPSLTGAMADHYKATTSRAVSRAAVALARNLGIQGLPDVDSPVPWLEAAARDLQNHSGRCLVLAGESQPPAIHALTHLMNERLASLGSVVVVTDPVEARPELQMHSLGELTREMRDGEVEALLILGGNPAFDAPADLEFAAALEQVPFRLHLTLLENETSRGCQWIVSQSHYLESWSDLRAFDGTASIVQPLIEPLYRSRSAHDLLKVPLNETGQSDYELVRQVWRRQWGEEDFERRWRRALHDGWIEGSALPVRQLSVDADAVLAAVARVDLEGEALELNLRPDPTVFDGRYANNAWLQELPKPLTKLTWDNALLASPALAERLGLSNDDLVEIAAGDRRVEAPVWIQPGHAPDSLTLYFGYGRSVAGRVGQGTGFDAYPIRTTATPWSIPEVSIKRTGRRRRLVSTQHHYSMEGRRLVRSGSLEEFRRNPDFVSQLAPEMPEKYDLYPNWNYPGYAWGMTIDLNSCTGCNACVAACQAENNIPVVGKEQVASGREMHWIRIDRYFEGSVDEPAVFHQPIPCMHCEQAPCEPVCPVAATVHSDEGLNDMVYNRCVGTRYCSNNCPYKVRRFNFLLYSDWATPSLKLQRNPNVTVRSRGVMEKCTYCVQRISAARIQASLEDRKIRDGEIRTACQQTCPADAIVFGDINDPNSRVSRLKASPLNYGLLTELNTRPRTTYLAKLKNPNPEATTE